MRGSGGGLRGPLRGTRRRRGAREGANLLRERPQIRIRRHGRGRRSPIWRPEGARSRRVAQDAAARERVCAHAGGSVVFRRPRRRSRRTTTRDAPPSRALGVGRAPREAVARARPGTRRLGLRALGARLRRARRGRRRRRAHELDVLHLDDVARLVAERVAERRKLELARSRAHSVRELLLHLVERHARRSDERVIAEARGVPRGNAAGGQSGEPVEVGAIAAGWSLVRVRTTLARCPSSSSASSPSSPAS